MRSPRERTDLQTGEETEEKTKRMKCHRNKKTLSAWEAGGSLLHLGEEVGGNLKGVTRLDHITRKEGGR